MEMESEETYLIESLGPENKQEELVIERPIGEVILGAEDPRLMTREDFGNSPDILFHGTLDNFMFSRDWDYQESESWNSSTGGFGFYATNSIEDAKLYAEAFQVNNNQRPIVSEIVPYQARMYDFRRDSTNANAPVPREILDSYSGWTEQRINQKLTEAGENLNYNIKNSYITYRDTLTAMKKGNNLPDLRSMLSTDGNPDSVNGPGIVLFPQYMKEIGYDGIIYTEGGDHAQHKDPVSYIFYNLDKIGTYATWHEDELKQSESSARETINSITSN